MRELGLIRRVVADIARRAAISEGHLVPTTSADIFRSPLASLARGVFLLL